MDTQKIIKVLEEAKQALTTAGVPTGPTNNQIDAAIQSIKQGKFEASEVRSLLIELNRNLVGLTIGPDQKELDLLISQL